MTNRNFRARSLNRPGGNGANNYYPSGFRGGNRNINPTRWDHPYNSGGMFVNGVFLKNTAKVVNDGYSSYPVYPYYGTGPYPYEGSSAYPYNDFGAHPYKGPSAYPCCDFASYPYGNYPLYGSNASPYDRIGTYPYDRIGAYRY